MEGSTQELLTTRPAAAPAALVLLLAAASGAAALIDEIVWFQLLELYTGSSAVSLAALLGTFMGGACVGSLIFPHVISNRRNPWHVYAAIEIGIGALGLLMLFAIPLAGGAYTAWAGYGLKGFLLRGAVAAACLAAPTLLIGATLPALARAVGDTPNRVAWLGGVYAANIAGGVLGCLAAGFYLLRVYDVTAAAAAAAAINAGIAVIALLLPAREKRVETNPPATPGSNWGASAVYVVIALSGFCALAAEAVWTRLLALLFGPSVYTFSLVLAVFLAGLGLGSGLGTVLAKNVQRPRLALGWLQLAGAGAIAWTAYNLSVSLPYWPIDPSIASSVWFNFQLDLTRAFWVLLAPTIVWGASFPLALAAAASATRESARLMAGVYAANTLGAIAGAVAASIVLIGWVGTHGVEQLLIGVSTVAGLALAVRRAGHRSAALAIGSAVVSGFLIWNVPPVAKELIAHGRYAATWTGKGDIVFAQEGVNASVAVSDFPHGVRTFHVAGKIQASSAPRDMRLQRLLGHLTTLAATNPRSVLVIGCGAGVTAGAVSIDPRVERVTIVEMEPLVPQAAATYFGAANFNVIGNSKVATRIDDGRHYLMTSQEHFDAITADPLDPWVKGAANLYTAEFLQTAKARLNPEGVVTLYIQLFETDLEAVKSAVATFVEVFPDATVWGNTVDGRGHDMVLMGTRDPLRLDVDAMEERLNRAEYMPVAQSLREVGIDSWVDFLGTYAGRGPDLGAWLESAVINRDRNLRLQYLAGLALDRDDSAAIYADMLIYRRFPRELFSGAPDRMSRLETAIHRDAP